MTTEALLQIVSHFTVRGTWLKFFSNETVKRRLGSPPVSSVPS